MDLSRRFRWLAGVCALVGLLGAREVHANPLDVQLRGLGPYVRGGDPAPGNRFRLLAAELGFALSPRTNGPATTTGMSGFQIDFDISIVNLNLDQDWWGNNATEYQRRTAAACACEGSRLPNTQGVAGFHIRKGLPFSLELEAHVNYLMNSTMFLVGADLKYTFLEGYKYVPNVSARAGVGRLLNAQEIDLTTVNLDITVSKSFPIAGMLELTPILGYGILFMNANSAVLDATPQDTTDNISIDQPGGSLYTLPEAPLGQNFHHRLTAGIELHTFIFIFHYQLDIGLVTGGRPVFMNTFRVGVQF